MTKNSGPKPRQLQFYKRVDPDGEIAVFARLYETAEGPVGEAFEDARWVKRSDVLQYPDDPRAAEPISPQDATWLMFNDLGYSGSQAAAGLSYAVIKGIKALGAWHLEYDNSGEMYSDGKTITTATIKQKLQYFDGQECFACNLAFDADESTLWCWGEPDKRIVEAWLGDTQQQYVVTPKRNRDTGAVTIRYGSDAWGWDETTQTVQASELMTEAEAISLFTHYFETKTISDDFVLVEKAYLHGE